MPSRFTEIGAQITSGVLAAAGITVASAGLIPSLITIAVSVLLTNIVWGLTQKWVNKANNIKIFQETQSIVIQNANSLLTLKEQEVEYYKTRIDQLVTTVTTLQSKIHQLDATVAKLKKENAHLVLAISDENLQKAFKDRAYLHLQDEENDENSGS